MVQIILSGVRYDDSPFASPWFGRLIAITAIAILIVVPILVIRARRGAILFDFYQGIHLRSARLADTRLISATWEIEPPSRKDAKINHAEKSQLAIFFARRDCLACLISASWRLGGFIRIFCENECVRFA